MGAAKAFIEVGDRRLIDTALLALAGASQRLVVGGEQPLLRLAAETAGARYVHDRWPGEGPLGAIVTALEAAACSTMVILPCDLPGIRPDDVASLVNALGEPVVGTVPAAAVFADHRRHFLPLALHTELLATAEDLFASGKRSVASLLDEAKVVDVVAPPGAVYDIDTPEDLAST